MNLAANTILITGGASGIGFALARQLSERGNRVIICGRNKEALRKAQSEVPALVTRTCDVADASDRRALVSWLNSEHPDLNILINNAGVQHRRNFTQADALENLDQEIAINLTAVVHLTGELLPLLRQQKTRPAIVNITSGLAFAPLAAVPVYCATKAALHSFTVSLRHQLKPTGVRVVEIAPPIVDTGLGGGVRSGGGARFMMSSDDFATEALAQLETGQDEVLVGSSVNTRKQGEALFERMNSF
jgi:uncharacterized oxidoreductase